MYAMGKKVCPWYAATMAMAALRAGEIDVALIGQTGALLAKEFYVRTLASLADWGRLDRSVVREAVEKYQVRDVQAAPAEERTDPSPAT